MIVEQIVGNLADLSDEELAGVHIERVVLPLAGLTKRVQRVTTDHGRELGIRLRDADLTPGAILVRDETALVVVAIEATDVLVIAPRTISEALEVAHGLGNRHLQAQFYDASETLDGLDGFDHDGAMVVPYDHTVEHFLEQHGVRYVRSEVRLRVPFRHGEHTH